MHHLNPVCIILVKRGGAGDRVLFRYPYSEIKKPPRTVCDGEKNPYTLHDLPEDMGNLASEQTKLTEKNILGLPSKTLANLFTASSQLCNAKFELKVDNVRFVGHPMSLEMKPEESKLYYRYRRGLASPTLSMFQVVFALSKNATYSVVKCYYELSKQLAIAIRYEDRRIGYLEKEVKLMLNAYDEHSVTVSENMSSATSPSFTNASSPFDAVLEVSQLARDLKKVFDNVTHTGYVDIRINSWSEVMFCLPQKVHKKITPNLLVEPESILKCIERLRPYHALLLLHDENQLISELPLDYNTAVKKVVQQASPMKNFRVLAADTDLSKLFVFQLSMQLLYWGKATVIYPLCNSNIYVVSPNNPNHLTPHLAEKFSESFSGVSLADVLVMFSLPNSISQALPSVSRTDAYQSLARMVVWCLQHHLLIQLHSYTSLALTSDCRTNLPDPLTCPRDDSRSTSPVNVSASDDEEVLKLNYVATPKGNDPKFEWPSLKTVRETGLHGRRRTGLKGKTVEQMLSVFDDEERTAILRVPAASNMEDLRMFVRLAPYFNGKYHKEDIMYHENVPRATLNQLLDKFREVLIAHEHEDVNVTTYFNTSIRS